MPLAFCLILTGIPHSEIVDDRKSGSSIALHTPEQIEIMREANRIGREVLDAAAAALRVGITGEEIDQVVRAACIARNVYPSPLNYREFPKSVCV